MDNTHNTNSFVPTWTEVTSFDFGEGVRTVVKRSDHRRPRYSVEIQFVPNTETQKTSRFFSVRYKGQGRIEVQRIHESLKKVMMVAEDWCEKEIQKDEDDREQAARERPRQSQGGTHQKKAVGQ